MDATAELKEKYKKSDFLNGFNFPNAETKDKNCIDIAFGIHGKVVADVSYEVYGMWTWVLCTDGSLWVLDKSHGGGGVFSLEKLPYQNKAVSK